MKNSLSILLFLIALNLYSQQKDVKTFTFEGQEIEYSRIDYSKYGIRLLYITMYSDTPANDKMEINGIGHLRSQQRLYHTLYFFLKIPKEIKPESKPQLFVEFMNHINLEEEIEKYNLYLNFDKNYSLLYQITRKKNNSINLKKISTEINPKNIWKVL